MFCAEFGWILLISSGEFFLKFVNLFSPFCYSSLGKKSVALHLYKPEFPSPNSRMLCFDETVPFWRRRILKFVNATLIFLLLSPARKRAWTFIWITLNFPYPIMFCAQFGWNGPSGSGDEFKHFVRNLLYCFFSLEKGVTLHLNQACIPFIKWCFEKSFVEIGSVVLENKILLVQCIYAILLLYMYQPWKRTWPFI